MGYTLEIYLALSPGDPQASPSMEKNVSVPCLKGGLGNTQCCNDLKDHPSASQRGTLLWECWREPPQHSVLQHGLTAGLGPHRATAEGLGCSAEGLKPVCNAGMAS